MRIALKYFFNKEKIILKWNIIHSHPQELVLCFWFFFYGMKTSRLPHPNSEVSFVSTKEHHHCSGLELQ